MGIVNTTPDSFSDGGKYNNLDSAFDHCCRLVDEGADIIDIGGESSRPGAKSVSLSEELERVIPLVERVSGSLDIVISIDTVKAEVARQALHAGAEIINDISAGRNDEKMASLAAEKDCYTVLMHSRKKPIDMQEAPYYNNTVKEVIEELLCSAEFFISQGVKKEKIILDPGIGFAKRFEDNLLLLRKSEELTKLGYEILIGTSRKSFIGTIADCNVDNRLAGSLASLAIPFNSGVRFFRVHDVEETVQFLKVIDSINGAS